MGCTVSSVTWSGDHMIWHLLWGHVTVPQHLLRFTQFCDCHSVPEAMRMPASEPLLALFVAEEGAGQVSGGTISSWLSGLQLWHAFNNALWAGGQILRRMCI